MRKVCQLLPFSIACLLMCFYLVVAPMTQGHVKDLGVLWMAARMVVAGDGRQLYSDDIQTQTMREAFDETVVQALQNRSGDESVGRLPYPPIQSILYSPLGLVSPRAAQTIVVYLSVVAAVVSAGCLYSIFGKAIPFSVVLSVILIQPAFFNNVSLGQNATFSLALVSLGWFWLARNNPILCGVCWGLLAYKPTWAVAVAWLPLVAGGLRVYYGMTLSVAVQVLISAMVTGVGSWIAWFKIALLFENVNIPYWGLFRRDLRNLLTHLIPNSPSAIGWLLVLGVVAGTCWVVRKQQNELRNPWILAFLSVALVLSCPRFMTYDLLISSPAWGAAIYCWPQATRLWQSLLVVIAAGYLISTLIVYYTWPQSWPWETVWLLLLWLWAMPVEALSHLSKRREETSPANEPVNNQHLVESPSNLLA